MSNTNGGIGFIGALTILFIAAKLWGKISWSWWWVISPIWISIALVLLILLIFLMGLLIKEWIDW